MTARNNVESNSTTITSSSLRPRNRRLISGLDDEDGFSSAPNTSASTRLGSPFDTPLGSRPISPIPASHLPRSSSRESIHSNRTRGDVNGTGRSNAASGRSAKYSSGHLSSMWGNSWTALQGMASDFLGGDIAQQKRVGVNSGRTERRTTNSATHARSVSTTGHWGPTASLYVPSAGDIGMGTREEQLAAFRAQKRRDMLTRQESSYADTLGKFKRRLSDDLTAQPVTTTDPETDALVYVHHVKKDDTLAGLSIRYHCSVANLRKANRMWPNDTVQVRERILLPVDACGIKGRLIDSPQDLDLLSSESEALSAGQAQEVPSTQYVPSSMHDSLDERIGQDITAHKAPPSISASSTDGDGLWQHDAWVLLPNCSIPTQILRVPRRVIAYFPPARRKSNPYTDMETPSTSLELSRPGINGTAGRIPISPPRTDSSQRIPTRPRGSSNADNGYFPAYLTGPGGVGTMGRDVKMPGPGPDSLNQMFAKHLPDVAPPRSQQALLTPELPLYLDDPPAPGSGSATPTAGRSLNLENVGGAIESWMRRVAGKTHHVLQPNGRQKLARASIGAPGRGVGGIGDLIEMTGDFDAGNEMESLESDDGTLQGVSRPPVASDSSGTSFHESNTILRGRSTTKDALKKAV